MKNSSIQLGLSIVAGAGIDLIVGLLLNQLAFGIVAGAVAGVVIGAVLSLNSKNK